MNSSSKRPPFFKILGGVFFKPEIFKELVNVKIESSIAFFLLLIFIFLLFQGVFISIRADRSIRTLERIFARHRIPAMKISGGRLTMDAPQPFVVNDENTGFVFVVDTAGSIIDLENYKKGFLLTGDRFIEKRNPYYTADYPLSPIEELTLDRETLTKWKDTFTGSALPIILIFMMASRIIIAGIYILLFAVAARFFHEKQGGKLQFYQYANISLYGAVLPAATMGVFEGIAGIWLTPPPAALNLLFFILYCLSLRRALQVLKPQVKPESKD